MPTVDELRSSTEKPAHLGEDEWATQLEAMAAGRKITAVDPKEVAWAKTPAVGRTIHAVKAQEDGMSDLQIITTEKRLGLTKEFATEGTERLDEIAVFIGKISKAMNDRAGHGDGTACTEDIVDALKAGGYAVLDAASGWFKPVEIEKAERADVEKQLGDVVEKALAVRRMLAEGDDEEGVTDETKGALKELSAALSKMVDEMTGEGGGDEDEDEDPPVVPQKTVTDGEADLKKAGEVAAVVGDKLEIMGTKLAELREGLGTLEAEEARAKLDAIDSALWDLRSDYLMLSKAMGVQSGHAIDAAAVTDLTKRLEAIETKYTEVTKSIEDTRTEATEGLELLNESLANAFNAGDDED